MSIVGAAILLAIGLVLMWLTTGVIHVIGLVLAIIAAIILVFILVQMVSGGAMLGRRRGPPPAV